MGMARRGRAQPRKEGELTMRASKKQLNYLYVLLQKAGWDTTYRNAQWKELGFSMKERSGRVADLTSEQASRAISALKEMVGA